MTEKQKFLKIWSLASMFAGLVLAIVGIVVACTGSGIAFWVLAADGLMSAISGFQGARAANTPSRTKGIIPIYVVACALGVVSVILYAVGVFAPQPSVVYPVLAVLVLADGLVGALAGNNVYQESLK
ncbi:MAG: hypothetical protein ACI361_01330 [Atopobiaceae bacterium]